MELLVETVGDGARGGFVGYTEDVEASDQTGILGCGALGAVEVGRDGDDSLGDGGSEVGSSSRASLDLATVFGLRVRLPVVGDDFERKVLHAGLDLRIVELAAEEALCVEDGVDEVHRGVTDEMLGVGERDIGMDGAVTLIIGDDLDMVVLPGRNAGECDP